jgi:hypothetical protein
MYIVRQSRKPNPKDTLLADTKCLTILPNSASIRGVVQNWNSADTRCKIDNESFFRMTAVSKVTRE